MNKDKSGDATPTKAVTSSHDPGADVALLFLKYWCDYYGLDDDVYRCLVKANSQQLRLDVATLTPARIRQLDLSRETRLVLRGAVLQYLSLKGEVDNHISRQIVSNLYGEEGVYKQESQLGFDEVEEQIGSLESRLESLSFLRDLDIDSRNYMRQKLRKKRVPAESQMTLAERIAQARKSVKACEGPEPQEKIARSLCQRLRCRELQEKSAVASNDVDKEMMLNLDQYSHRNEKAEGNEKYEFGTEEHGQKKAEKNKKQRRKDKTAEKKKKQKKEEDENKKEARDEGASGTDKKEKKKRKKEKRNNKQIDNCKKEDDDVESLERPTENEGRKTNSSGDKEVGVDEEVIDARKRKRKKTKKTKTNDEDDDAVAKQEDTDARKKRKKKTKKTTVNDEDDDTVAEQEDIDISKKRKKKTKINDEDEDAVAEQEVKDDKKKKKKKKKIKETESQSGSDR